MRWCLLRFGMLVLWAIKPAKEKNVLAAAEEVWQLIVSLMAWLFVPCSCRILLYEMLCGVPPFRAKSRNTLQTQILRCVRCGRLRLTVS